MSFVALNREALKGVEGTTRTVLTLILTECCDRDYPDFQIEGKPFPLRRGQWVGSLSIISRLTGLSIKQTRTALDFLCGASKTASRRASKGASMNEEVRASIRASTATNKATLYHIENIDYFINNKPSKQEIGAGTGASKNNDEGQAEGRAQGQAKGQENNKYKQKGKKEDPPKGVSSKERKLFDFDKAVMYWNASTGSNIDASKATKEQRRSMANAVRRLEGHYGVSSQEAWERLCDYVTRNDLLAGRKEEWKASISWVLKPGNLTKIIDGDYDRWSREGVSKPIERKQQAIDPAGIMLKVLEQVASNNSVKGVIADHERATIRALSYAGKKQGVIYLQHFGSNQGLCLSLNQHYGSNMTDAWKQYDNTVEEVRIIISS